MGATRTKILGKAGVVTRSVFPWARPIMVVLKHIAPGKPQRKSFCIDYRSVIKLLSPVTKTLQS